MKHTKIYKVGFEVEGEFSQTLTDKLKEIGETTGDPSLRHCGSPDVKNTPYTHKKLDLVEFRSDPMLLKDVGEYSEKVFNLFDKYRKKKQFHWNEKAGMHVHISFNRDKRVTPEIYSIEFVDMFHKELKKHFAKVVEERGDNRFCRMNITEQEVATRIRRYSSINMHDALEKHGTIEFRIFPADTPKQMQRYLNFTITTIQSFLKQQDKLLKRKEIIHFEEDVEKILNLDTAIAEKPETDKSNFDIRVEEVESRDRERSRADAWTFPNISPF